LISPNSLAAGTGPGSPVFQPPTLTETEKEKLERWERMDKEMDDEEPEAEQEELPDEDGVISVSKNPIKTPQSSNIQGGRGELSRISSICEI